METLTDQITELNTPSSSQQLPQSKKRRLAHIEKISKINPIFLKSGPNGNVIAEVLNWKVIIPKGKYQEGEYVIYCEIDSIMPDNKDFQYLKEKDLDGLHIKTYKLGNQISQGAIFPVSILDNYPKPKDFKLSEGLEVTDILGITKFEAPIKQSKPKQAKPQKAEPLPFPNFIEQTDEERIQNLPQIFTEKYLEFTYYVTEKIDGMSSSFYWNQGKFGVCSRNIELIDQSNDYWRMAIQYKLKEKLEKYGQNIALQGEIIGPGIMKNRYNCKNKMLLFYSVWDIEKSSYVDFNTFERIMKELDLPIVPILEREYKLPKSIEELLKYVNGVSKLNFAEDKSIPNNIREGIVIRTIINIPERVSFKAISNEYLLETHQ